MERKKRAPEQLLLNEIQVLLAEKRTYYALLRSAIAVVTLPLTVVVFLLATTDYHGLFLKPWVSYSIIIMLLIIALFGLLLMLRANRRISKIHVMIQTIKSQNKRIAEIVLE